MNSRLFVPWCALSAVVVAACTGEAPSDTTTAAVIEHARANVTLLSELDALRAAGWQVAELTAAKIDTVEAPASGCDETSSQPEITWSRITVAAALAPPAAGEPLRVELVLAWAAGEDDQLALVPHSPAAEESALDAIDASAALPAGGVHPLVSIGTTCHSDGDCGGGGNPLTCFGPDNHLTCQCSSTNSRTIGYTISHGFHRVACTSIENPSGGYHVRHSVSGCGQTLITDACGGIHNIPFYVTSTSASSTICGYNC